MLKSNEKCVSHSYSDYLRTAAHVTQEAAFCAVIHLPLKSDYLQINVFLFNQQNAVSEQKGNLNQINIWRDHPLPSKQH